MSDLLKLIIITYMVDYRHNRRDESRFKNSLLPRLSYKHVAILHYEFERDESGKGNIIQWR
ncbi:hypothetical protein MTBBW1_1240002 [Desulfamplus magnetovallimortis]|uniref:Uncharacterized protein n=1 Tax=Desulfamplus magnetovallimortis TaxID=1246637 RepID=A0A1W1H6H6_9BACT|nr:hypothetical protein MTBBW1_1240002 [Desulfamplus magnetovallimortis]